MLFLAGNECDWHHSQSLQTWAENQRIAPGMIVLSKKDENGACWASTASMTKAARPLHAFVLVPRDHRDPRSHPNLTKILSLLPSCCRCLWGLDANRMFVALFFNIYIYITSLIKKNWKKSLCACVLPYTHVNLHTQVCSENKLKGMKRVLFSEFHCGSVFLWATVTYFNMLVMLMSLCLLKLLSCLSQPPSGLAVSSTCWEVGGKVVVIKKTFECYFPSSWFVLDITNPFFSGSNILGVCLRKQSFRKS